MSSLLKAMTMRCKALEIRCEPGRYTDTISHSATRNFEGKAEQDWYMPAAYVAELREMTARPAIKAGKIHERICNASQFTLVGESHLFAAGLWIITSQGCNYRWLVGETIWNHPKLTLSQVGEFLQYVSHPICFDLLTPLTAGARNAGAWRLRDRCWRLRFMAREGVARRKTLPGATFQKALRGGIRGSSSERQLEMIFINGKPQRHVK